MKPRDWIIEKQHNATPKVVLAVWPDHWIRARGVESGRVTKIAWRNRHRYRVVPEQPVSVREYPVTNDRRAGMLRPLDNA